MVRGVIIFATEDIERLFGFGKKMKTKMEKKNATKNYNDVGDKGEDGDDGDDKEGGLPNQHRQWNKHRCQLQAS